MRCSRPYCRRHEARQLLPLLAREAQAELAAPPQHIVRGLRPFTLHQISDFRTGEISPEVRSEVFQAPRRPEQPLGPGAIGADQPAHLRLAEEWTRAACLFDERLQSVMGK